MADDFTGLAAACLLAFQLPIVGFLLANESYRVCLMRTYRRLRGPDPPPERRFPREELPRVTIQLPVRNEGEMFERCLRSAAAVDHPDDRLQIQVLDDSDDGVTTELIGRVLEELRLEHPRRDFQCLRRDSREGFKAGALRRGVDQASGEFFAIFDADFTVPKDFLARTIHYFTDPEVAVVQARWAFLNRNESLLTRLQAAKLDAHQMFEQTARFRSGRRVAFHGTAGIWRASALEEAGGWKCATEVEDIELSIRSFARRHRVMYLDHLRVPSELPTSIHDYLTQQMRWKRGYTRLALLYNSAIARAPAPLRERLDMLQRIHLVWGPALALLMTLCVLPVFAAAGRLGLTAPIACLYLTTLVVSLVGRILETRTLTEDPRHDPADLLPLPLRLLPLNHVLAMGTSWALTQATAEGFGARRYWEVTHKRGATASPRGVRIPLALRGTVVVAVASTALAVVAVLGSHALAVVFYALLALGSAWVAGALALEARGRRL